MAKALTREDLRNQLRRREIAPVYVLFGAETYLRDLAGKTIADLCFSEGDLREFNETEFSLSSGDNLREALAAACQLPMMAARRVVRITGIRVGASSARDTLKEEHEKALEAYLSRPSETSVVVFVADELNGVRRITRLLKEHAVAVEFATLNENELIQWARTKVNERGSDIDERDLRELVALVGSDVCSLTNEIEKLSTAALPDKQITAELIGSLVANTRELTNFELTDHLIAGRKAKAMEVLEKILDDGAEPLALLGLIAYNFRRLLMAKEMMQRGVDRREVANVVKLRFNDQEQFLAAARRSDARKLTRILEQLAETDIAIKTSVGGSGPQGSRMQIEALVCSAAAL